MKTHYLRALRPVIHAIVIAWAFWWAYILRQHTDLIPRVQIRIPPFIISELIIFAAISIGLYVLIWRQRKLFQLYGLVLWYYQRFLKSIVTRWVLITCLAFFGAGFLFSGWVSRFVIVIAVVWSLIMITIVDGIFDAILYRVGRRYQIALLAQDTAQAQEAHTLLSKTSTAQVRLINYHSRNPDHLDQYDTVILVWWLPREQLEQLADQVTISGTEFFHVQDDNLLQDLIFTPQKLWPLVWLEYKASVIDERSLVVKRIVDVVGAIVWIILLSPIMSYVAYRIKREDGGPVFFVQERVWLGGRGFRFFKFRSMKLEHCTWSWYGWKQAEQYYETLIQSDLNTRPWSMPKIHNDPRVTSIGRWIRAKSLDELPQLWNVLLWDMSLIGPRPHLAREVAWYESRQHRLLSVKPGITWYAQIFGRDTLDFNEEAKLDLYYIQHWSLWMDLYVMFATLGVISKWR